MSREIAPNKPTIPLSLLEKIDFRVGTIERVEDIKGSAKLVKPKVNFGNHERQIVVGMKKIRENPNEVEGSKPSL